MDNTINGRTPEEIKKGLECCNMHQCPLLECPYFNDEYCGETLNADALAYIQHLESAQPKWISVEERLPDGKCVAVNDLGFMMIGYVRECTGGKGYRCDDEHDVFGMMGVTHWMPLPEPPKEMG